MIRERSMRQIPDRPFAFSSQQHFPRRACVCECDICIFLTYFLQISRQLDHLAPDSLPSLSLFLSIFVCVTIFTLCHKMFTVDLYNECVCVHECECAVCEHKGRAQNSYGNMKIFLFMFYRTFFFILWLFAVYSALKFT